MLADGVVQLQIGCHYQESKPVSRTIENPEQNVAHLFETLEKQALKSISKLNTSVSSHEYISIYPQWTSVFLSNLQCRSHVDFRPRWSVHSQRDVELRLAPPLAAASRAGLHGPEGPWARSSVTCTGVPSAEQRVVRRQPRRLAARHRAGLAAARARQRLQTTMF